ncbi:MAG: hypothetical protein A2V46_16190 [Bacteroidetes bacterium RBG_19FT_COMBO_42_7]|nr:MAG: hypothetical protein A2V46_16190 [Bacteroidetes bacterium RBG_19FT_COMBO_42_7]
MRKNNFFWVGYSDLMTSMFFIMLVLFVITIGYLQVKISENERLIEELKIREQGLIQETERLQKLLNLEEQFRPLIDDNSFYYLSDCKKFIVKDLMGIEIFNPNKVVIKPEYISRTISAGKKIDAFLGELSEQNKGFSYLLVIEGNMANDFKKPKPVDRPDFYLKSYERALAVYNLWLKNGINFRQYDVEVMICGSGLNGLCRDPVEENNKRFSIQIIPKVSK